MIRADLERMDGLELKAVLLEISHAELVAAVLWLTSGVHPRIARDCALDAIARCVRSVHERQGIGAAGNCYPSAATVVHW